jgi:hypothetical protein
MQKIESVEEFLARGGQIKKCATRTKAKRFKPITDADLVVVEEEIDWSLIPQHILIRLGKRHGEETK